MSFLQGSIDEADDELLFFARESAAEFVTSFRVGYADGTLTPIVEVQTELVSKGKGSVFAYVPIVEISDEAGNKLRVKMATFNEEPVYRVGDKTNVLCDLSQFDASERISCRSGETLP